MAISIAIKKRLGRRFGACILVQSNSKNELTNAVGWASIYDAQRTAVVQIMMNGQHSIKPSMFILQGETHLNGTKSG